MKAKKYIFEIFNLDKYVCCVLASSLEDAINQAKKKVNFEFIIIDTNHCIN